MKLRDALREDNIEVNEEDWPIVDSPEFQRLRNIKQLGLSSLVYAGAEHTRFSHSLGVYDLTKDFIKSLQITDEVKQRRLRQAALLHDIGHGPYSHVIEKVEGTIQHEKHSERIIRELADQGKVLESDVEPIIEYINGNRNPNIISGDIDADRLDYLKRDSHRSGVNHGYIDYATIIDSAELTTNDEIIFSEIAIQAIEGMLVARKNMRRSVYLHPTVRASEKMLAEAISNCEIDTDELYSYTDDALLHQLSIDDNPKVRELANRLKNRKLYKNAFSIRQMDNISDSEINKLETHIKENANLPSNEIFTDKYQLPKSDLNVKINVKQTAQNRDIFHFDEVSNIKSLIENSGYSIQFSVYVPEEHKEYVNEICTEFIKNEVN